MELKVRDQALTVGLEAVRLSRIHYMELKVLIPVYHYWLYTSPRIHYMELKVTYPEK